MEIRAVRELDESVVKAVAEMRKSGEKRLKGQEWEEEQGLVLYREKVYVPKDGELCRRLVHSHHDTPVAGHCGQWKMWELISRNYW